MYSIMYNYAGASIDWIYATVDHEMAQEMLETAIDMNPFVSRKSEEEKQRDKLAAEADKKLGKAGDPIPPEIYERITKNIEEDRKKDALRKKGR